MDVVDRVSVPEVMKKWIFYRSTYVFSNSVETDLNDELILVLNTGIGRAISLLSTSDLVLCVDSSERVT